MEGVWEPLDGLLFNERGGRHAATSASPITLCNAEKQLLIEVNLQAQADLHATMVYLVKVVVKTGRQAAGQWHRGCDEPFRRRSSIEGIALSEHGLLYKRMWGPGGRGLWC